MKGPYGTFFPQRPLQENKHTPVQSVHTAHALCTLPTNQPVSDMPCYWWILLLCLCAKLLSAYLSFVRTYPQAPHGFLTHTKDFITVWSHTSSSFTSHFHTLKIHSTIHPFYTPCPPYLPSSLVIYQHAGLSCLGVELSLRRGPGGPDSVAG